jgi:hypothetical protein
MCKPREHGARAVEILPEQRAAIVNFASYEHACNALKGLQGALIGKITRPGLAIAWHKRQEEQQRQPVMMQQEPGEYMSRAVLVCCSVGAWWETWSGDVSAGVFVHITGGCED